MKKDPNHTEQRLNHYLAKEVREYIEKNFYGQINEKATLDEIKHDAEFLRSMYNHIALFSDHGIVHVRDVACLMLKTLDDMLGVHIYQRSDYRQNFMKGYGVMTAYLHDIGMINFSALGRKVHSEFAAQEVFSTSFDRYIDIIWQENCGNVPWRIMDLCNKGFLQGDPKVILRECLALVPAHSKSKFSIGTLNNPKTLRARILEVLQYDLRYLYYKNHVQDLSLKLKRMKNTEKKKVLQRELNQAKKMLRSAEKAPLCQKTKRNLKRFYQNFSKEALSWLTSKEPELLDFIDDITDTLRALRCADAFRQRGTSFKTSGGYQIFVNLHSGNAVFALCNKKKQMFLLEVPTAHAIGEANIANAEYNAEGDLTLAFYTGRFSSETAILNAAKNIAMIIYDLKLDVVESLILPKNYRHKETIRKKTPIKILLENVHDNWKFTKYIANALIHFDPSLKSLIHYTTPLTGLPEMERQRYMNSSTTNFTVKQKKDIIKKVGLQGHKTKSISPSKAFKDVHLITIRNGEYLLEAETPPGFVYIPLNRGLVGAPLGGYELFTIPAYTFIGNSSVISGTHRNASVFAEKNLKVLMLPQEIYLSYWHDTYDQQELKKVLLQQLTKDK